MQCSTAAVIFVFRLVRRSLLRLMTLILCRIYASYGGIACGFTVSGRLFFDQPFEMVYTCNSGFSNSNAVRYRL